MIYDSQDQVLKGITVSLFLSRDTHSGESQLFCCEVTCSSQWRGPHAEASNRQPWALPALAEQLDADSPRGPMRPRTRIQLCMLACEVASVVSNSVRPHGQQPTRLLCPQDSPGKSAGGGCHFPLSHSQFSTHKNRETVNVCCFTLLFQTTLLFIQ